MINKFLFYSLSILLLGCKSTPETRYSGNPLFEGHYADPFAAIYDSTVWVFPTYSDKYERQVYMDAFSSKDLIQWTKHSSIIDTASVKWAKRAMWAPSSLEHHDKYYLFFAANDIHEGESGGIGVAVSDVPQGPYVDLLGKPLIGEIINGAQPIDQHVFKDDSVIYMYYGGWRHCNVVRLSDDLKTVMPFEDGTTFKEITPAGYVEGPFMFKKDGIYYFMWSEGNWGDSSYNVAYAMSDSPTGPFNRIGQIFKPDSTIGKGAGHHSIIQAAEKFFIVYHRRPPNENHPNARVTCIESITFDRDGKINPVSLTKTGVSEL